MGSSVPERILPGAGSPGDAGRPDVGSRSIKVLAGVRRTERAESQVSAGTLCGVHDADDPVRIEAHAPEGGLPCDRVSWGHGTISPATGRCGRGG